MVQQGRPRQPHAVLLVCPPGACLLLLPAGQARSSRCAPYSAATPATSKTPLSTITYLHKYIPPPPPPKTNFTCCPLQTRCTTLKTMTSCCGGGRGRSGMRRRRRRRRAQGAARRRCSLTTCWRNSPRPSGGWLLTGFASCIYSSHLCVLRIARNKNLYSGRRCSSTTCWRNSARRSGGWLLPGGLRARVGSECAVNYALKVVQVNSMLATLTRAERWVAAHQSLHARVGISML